jgi:hypothetical protein
MPYLRQGLAENNFRQYHRRSNSPVVESTPVEQHTDEKLLKTKAD